MLETRRLWLLRWNLDPIIFLMSGFLVYKNCKFSWNVLVCLGMLGYVLISLGMGGILGYVGVCWGVFWYIGVCGGMLGVFWGLLGYARVCLSMLGYFGACMGVLRYVYVVVCFDMLYSMHNQHLYMYFLKVPFLWSRFVCYWLVIDRSPVLMNRYYGAKQTWLVKWTEKTKCCFVFCCLSFPQKPVTSSATLRSCRAHPDFVRPTEYLGKLGQHFKKKCGPGQRQWNMSAKFMTLRVKQAIQGLEVLTSEKVFSSILWPEYTHQCSSAAVSRRA